MPFQRESGGAPAALIALREAVDPPAFDAGLVATPDSAESSAEAEAWRGLAALAREPERARFYAEMAAAALASRD